ncbi:uncharacterized protein [Coffea arabica]|uniref:Gamma-tubulin complex component n=1 Tax=Coffea arabica TaxID=13443 RepID=A0ABM4W0I9_COFAR
MEVPASLISKVHSSFSDGLHFAAPLPSLSTSEIELVKGALHICQGFSSDLFYWDHIGQSFRVKTGIYVSHLTRTSLYGILDQFTYAATCLKLVEILVNKIHKSARSPPPTLRAFACSVSAWLKKLRDVALREEENISTGDGKMIATLLGLSSSLSSLCSGAEYLLQIVHEAVPGAYFEPNSYIAAADVAVYILNQLYRKLDEVCLVQGGEEDAYRMLLYIFTGSLLPYVEGLDSWLFEGTLDDPFEEMFFYANKGIAIDETEFWEKSYLLRTAKIKNLEIGSSSDVLLKDKKDITGRESISTREKEGGEIEHHVCPLFIKDMGKAIVSAGKSLQLIRHAPLPSLSDVPGDNHEIRRCIAGLTLSEVFCVSLAALIGHSDHISEYVWHDNLIVSSFESPVGKEKEERNGEILPFISSDKVWYKILANVLGQKREIVSESTHIDTDVFSLQKEKLGPDGVDDVPCVGTYCPQNPAITVCQRFLYGNKDAQSALSLSRNLYLPPLDDKELRKAVFYKNSGSCSEEKSTDFTFGFWFDESEYVRRQEETKMLEMLFPFMTLLPSFQEDLHISEFLPFEKNSTLPSRILSWMQSAEPKVTPLPVVILQECLIAYIKKQESIRNSADGSLLSTPDSLVVSITKNSDLSEDEQHGASIQISTPRKSRLQTMGIDVLQSLNFTYKVSWPLELLANVEALKKYNQVMIFLLKVKRAKFVLDKARRWMWKDRSTATTTRKRHWLLEQKLLHFVNAFHQYVMDRVYHSAWRELCEGVAAAGSLDEVIEVHESYLLSIQRQCFVVPDKLWALIASRINNILGLALDFYSIQQTLSSGGAVSAIKTRCEMEVDRIERQFDECIAFLLRILSFKLNVGQFPHLADLVTRINYNYFYMSDSGSLMTTSGSDVITSR